jgi:hypothetical protein
MRTRLTVLFALFAMTVIVGVTALAGDQSKMCVDCNDTPQDLSPSSSPTFSSAHLDGDITFDQVTGADFTVGATGYNGGTRTDDANSSNFSVNPSDVYPFAATAKTAGHYIVRGGIDSKTVNVLDGLAHCTNDTVTATYYVNSMTATTTTCTYGVNWGTGGGLTATIAATQLAACLDAGVGIGATASGATCPGGAANARCVGLTPDRGVSGPYLTQTPDANCAVLSFGTDGSVVVPTDVQNTGVGIIFQGDPDTQIRNIGSNSIEIRSGGQTYTFSAAGMTGTQEVAGATLKANLGHVSSPLSAAGPNLRNYSVANSGPLTDGTGAEIGVYLGSNAATELGQISCFGANVGGTLAQSDLSLCIDNQTLHTGEGPGIDAGSADVAPKTFSIKSENASPLATTPASKIGAAQCVSGGLGQRTIQFVSTVATTGKAITFNGTMNCAAVTPLVFTEGGAGYACLNGATTASCALSLKNIINGTAVATLNAAGIERAQCTTAGGATCSDGIVAIRPLPSCQAMTITDDAAAEITEPSGVDGAVNLSKNTRVAETFITYAPDGTPATCLKATNTDPYLYLYDGNDCASMATLTVAYISSTITGGAGPAFVLADGMLTTATMGKPSEHNAKATSATSAFAWTNAQVVALGANLEGDISVVTLPAHTVVRNMYLRVATQCAGLDTLTVSVGRTAAAYEDYITDSDVMAAANTIYGDASAERGANLTGYDMPSYAAATTVYAHFTGTDAGADKLAQVTGCTGEITLETTLMP